MKVKDEHKSVFDDRFYFVKVPIEVLKIPDLTSDDRMILSRILYWSRKGMPCTHTNEQFAELIGKCENTARNVVYKLIKQKLVDAHYLNDGKLHRKGAHRDLTALVGLPSKMVIKRKAIQAIRAMGKKQKTCQPVGTLPASPLAGIDQKPASILAGTTNDKQLKKQLSAGQSLLPVGQAPPAKEKKKRKALSEKEFAVQKERQLKALEAGEKIRGCDDKPPAKDENYIR